MPRTVLIVDDEETIRRVLVRTLDQASYHCEQADSPAAALELLREEPVDVLLTDLSMPPHSGLELLDEVRAAFPRLPVVMMSGQGTIELALAATRKGALDFLEKPITKERLLVTVGNALRFARLQSSHERLAALAEPTDLIGQSTVMMELRRMIAKVGPTPSRVLITGENGTGKELVAAALHRTSARADAPYVKLNCAAVPKDLVESELFGHVKGAFTGALKARRGKFEQADGGTLLLDEVGDMPLPMQAKLLRVLQEGEVERVGGDRTTPVDVRVLAATNRDLKAAVDEGTFREDLYYRLNVVTIPVPSLRQRRDDIPLLVHHFAGRVASLLSRAEITITPEAIAALQEHDFPGNVRELSNLVERLAILCENDTIHPKDVIRQLPELRSVAAETAGARYQRGVALRELMRDAEREIIEQAIEAHGGNKSATARDLQVERSHFYKKCQKLALE